WVNLEIEVFARDGTPLYGPVPGNSLWSGFGGVCETQNQGDPIALYDPFSDRWVLSQFSFALAGPNPKAPFHQCIAVSTSPDPTGSYFRYDYVISNTLLNDYPKFGVWPNAYFMSINQYSGNTFAGPAAVAFDRAKMVAGQPATGVIATLSTAYFGLLPATVTGPRPPPAGAAGRSGAA